MRDELHDDAMATPESVPVEDRPDHYDPPIRTPEEGVTKQVSAGGGAAAQPTKRRRGGG